MAKSPAHRLGQIIGEALELAYEPILRDFADEHDLYLDRQGPRAARPGKKVSWVDINGNKHDLDFVLERGGTAQRVGVPAAFIESAWRRYTKHSRAKAQEMQGAIEPLLLAHQAAKPFAGAIVGGEWTSASLTQLRSVGFTVVHLSFSEIVAAFGTVGIDVATEEGTPLPVLQAAVDACDGMSQADKDRVGDELRACAAADFADFRSRLAGAVLRKVERVTLADKSYPAALNYWTVASAGWDNAAEIFVKAIDILAEGGDPRIPAIRESFKVANTTKVEPPKFDPKQAIWDAGGWPILKDRSVSIVGEDAKVYFEYGGKVIEPITMGQGFLEVPHPYKMFL